MKTARNGKPKSSIKPTGCSGILNNKPKDERRAK
jgi:hypothetical protein